MRTLYSTAEGMEAPDVPALVQTAVEAQQLIDDLQSYVSELEELEGASADFPGMY